MTMTLHDRMARLVGEVQAAHHDYEQRALGGQRDDRWAEWYARYLVVRGFERAGLVTSAYSDRSLRAHLALHLAADEVPWGDDMVVALYLTGRGWTLADDGLSADDATHLAVKAADFQTPDAWESM